MYFEVTDGSILAEKTDFSDYPYHTHNSIEIIICSEGSVDIVCNNQQKTLTRGDIMIAFPHDIHAYKSKNGKGYTIKLPARLSSITYVTLKAGKYENFLHNEDVLFYAEELYKCIQRRHSLSVAYGYAHIIFGEITHNLPYRKSSLEATTFQKAIEYMTSNYEKTISLKEVAKAVGIDQSYLSRMFSEKIEGGFKNYLNFMKVEKAKRLLEMSDMKMYEILEKCGFVSHYTFDRVFKKHTGMTPREYRTEAKAKNVNF